jgi:murein DD-endopeptidase MepM/ murein hydrolase activator NlpD
MDRLVDRHTPLGLLLLGIVIGVASGTGVLILALLRAPLEAPPVLATAPPAIPLVSSSGLVFPVRGGPNTRLRDSFDEARGARIHAALDILAPRGTPVLAVCDGHVTRLSNGRLSGIALDLVDGADHYCYYYAHLAAYAAGLQQGQAVSRGQVLGYVGNTGNAAQTSPHLHFAIFALPGGGGSCYSGTPLNPYVLLR